MYKKLADFYIEALLNQFCLVKRLDGFYHSFTEGKVSFFTKVTESEDKVLTFIDLDPVAYHNGFDSTEEVFDFIISSKYFNRFYFKELDLTSLDEEVQNEAEKFPTYMHQLDVRSKYKPSLHDEVYLHVVDYAFPESHIKKRVYERFYAQLVLLPYEYKINPNLIASWYPMIASDQIKINQLLNLYIRKIGEGDHFASHLAKMTPAEVEVEFCKIADEYIEEKKAKD